MVKFVVAAALLACACGKGKDDDPATCTQARDQYLQNARAEIGRLVERIPARQRENLDSTIEGEIATARANFTAACAQIGATKILDCTRMAAARDDFTEECQAVYAALQKVLYKGQVTGQ